MPNELLPMSPDEFNLALDKLGLSQVGCGHFLGIDPRTVRYYASGGHAVPKLVALLLRTMVRKKITLEDAAALRPLK
jgi:hypothetical protein